jgi:adenylylsulfate kinase
LFIPGFFCRISIRFKNNGKGGATMRMNEHAPGVIWFTGLPGSGKTTLAVAAEAELNRRGFRCVVLDGDRLRLGLCSDLGYSEADRIENLRRASEVAVMFAEAGFIVLAPMISPSETGRAKVRSRFRQERFAELYVKCSLAECERRDPKGMYKKARSGEIASFTGISAPYEAPGRPDLTVDTELEPLGQCVDAIIGFITRQFN